jgi:hypothetical protein
MRAFARAVPLAVILSGCFGRNALALDVARAVTFLDRMMDKYETGRTKIIFNGGHVASPPAPAGSGLRSLRRTGFRMRYAAGPAESASEQPRARPRMGRPSHNRLARCAVLGSA